MSNKVYDCLGSLFLFFLAVVVAVVGENFRKPHRVKIKKKFRNPWFLAKISELFGGDKRDRTADLLNAIRTK